MITTEEIIDNALEKKKKTNHDRILSQKRPIPWVQLDLLGLKARLPVMDVVETNSQQKRNFDGRFAETCIIFIF